MGSEHKQFLQHYEIRWLSRVKALPRLFELRVFLLGDDSDANQKATVNDKNWLKRLTYLADIFLILNVLKLTLQDKDIDKF